MRVLISAYQCGPASGTEAANAWHTALGLAAAGMTVHVLSAGQFKSESLPHFRDARAQGLSLSVTYLGGPSSNDSKPVARSAYLQYAAFQWSVSRWVGARHDWDVAHHIAWGSLSHPVGLLRSKGPIVVGPIGGGQVLLPGIGQWVDGSLGWQRARNQALTRALRGNPFARSLARRSDIVFAANRETRDALVRLQAKRVEMLLPEVIPNRTGVKVDPPRAGRVVWIGRFLPIKAARLAISSFRWVLESQPTAELIMIGAGPTLEQNRSEASDLVLEGRLRFLGGLPWRQGQEILGSADVHLQTSVRDSSSAQAMEAASLGVPTVALKLGGMRDFFDDSSGAALIDPLPGWDVDRRLGDAVAALLGEGSRLRSERRGKALRFAEGYCVAARVNHLAETYGRLVSRP